jgi:ABC-type nitrate/sulfonate/bicarbonate transport system permease component
MGTGGLGQKMNVADSFGLYEQVYALALATGFLGLAIHFASGGFERWALRWHPSQRTERT